MLCRITGALESVSEDGRAIVAMEQLGVAREVLLPASAVEPLRTRIGRTVTLHTIQRFEQEAQGAAMTPTLLAFLSEEDRRFFRVFTRVRGVGARKALRAMSAPTSEIARAIAQRDAVWLVSLPEIGKRLAETIIADLADRMAPFLAGPASVVEAADGGEGPLRDAVETAIAAMVRLGENRSDAQRRLAAALRRQPELKTADELLAAAYAAADGDAG